MSFKDFYEEETGIKFKDYIDFSIFILFNILATPGLWIISAIVWGVPGFVVNIIVALIVFLIWKLYGSHNGTLSFNPSFRFGNKTFRTFKK